MSCQRFALREPGTLVCASSSTSATSGRRARIASTSISSNGCAAVLDRRAGDDLEAVRAARSSSGGCASRRSRRRRRCRARCAAGPRRAWRRSCRRPARRRDRRAARPGSCLYSDDSTSGRGRGSARARSRPSPRKPHCRSCGVRDRRAREHRRDGQRPRPRHARGLELGVGDRDVRGRGPRPTPSPRRRAPAASAASPLQPRGTPTARSSIVVEQVVGSTARGSDADDDRPS